MKTKHLTLYLLTFIIASCATSLNTDSKPSSSPYNIGYNDGAKSCNDIIYYSKKYNHRIDTPTSPSGSLWGLITTADIGFANSATKLSGQKDAIASIPTLNKQTLYSSISFLNKCNFNPNYAEYCNTAYKAYLSAYQAESNNLKQYDTNKYIAGFNDSVRDCDNKFIAPPPLTPLDLK